MKKGFALLLALTLLLALAGCGGAASSAPASSAAQASSAAPGSSSAAATPAADIKVAYLCENLGDNAANDEAAGGVQRYMADKGVDITIVEMKELQDFEINARNFAQDGYDLILSTNSDSAELISAWAEDYPDTTFVFCDGNIEGIANIACWQVRIYEAGFLTGAFNALMNEELGGAKEAAIILGQRNANLERSQYSFMAGAAWVGGTGEALYVGSFTDPAKGKEIALQKYNGGMKIMQSFAGGSGLGVYQAAESLPEGNWVMGAAYGQFDISDRIIASMVRNNGNIWYKLIDDYVAGALQGGSVLSFGIEDGACGIKYGNAGEGTEVIPQSIKDQVQELEDKVVSGEIVPPATEEEYTAFEAEHLS